MSAHGRMTLIFLFCYSFLAHFCLFQSLSSGNYRKKKRKTEITERDSSSQRLVLACLLIMLSAAAGAIVKKGSCILQLFLWHKYKSAATLWSAETICTRRTAALSEPFSKPSPGTLTELWGCSVQEYRAAAGCWSMHRPWGVQLKCQVLKMWLLLPGWSCDSARHTAVYLPLPRTAQSIAEPRGCLGWGWVKFLACMSMPWKSQRGGRDDSVRKLWP